MKEELDKMIELRRIEASIFQMGLIATMYPESAKALVELSQDLRSIMPDIEEGLKLLAIKRLQDSLDDGNSGFIQVGDR